MRALPKLVEELLRADQRTHAGNDFLHLLEAESVLVEEIDAVVHELVVVWFIARGAAKIRYSRRLSEGYPYLGHKNALKV